MKPAFSNVGLGARIPRLLLRLLTDPALLTLLVVAPLAYFYHLDSLHIPNIGDEPLYIHIVRVTAAQGTLLPLRAETGIRNTKPPLLFWQGILSTSWGRHWTLWRLRLPIVMITAAAAVLVGLVAARLSRDKRTGVIAASIYLGWFSTFQHGRPFLVNAPETLFLFAPLALLLIAGRFSWPITLLSALLLGIASLYKSFFLIAPVTLAFAMILRRRREVAWPIGAFRLGVLAAIALGIFALWLIADPHPEKIIREFILHENLGKFDRVPYLRGLFSGDYPLIRIWLGSFANALFYALPLIGLFWASWKRSRIEGGIPAGEKDLWLYVLAFLIVYSIPSQRQENYLLPAAAALSVLLALNWERIPSGWFRAASLLVAACLGGFLFFMLQLPRAVPEISYPSLKVVVVAVMLLASVAAAANGSRARRWLPGLVLGCFFSLGLGLSPFDRGFESAPGGPGMGSLRGRTIWFPRPRSVQEEPYRFLVPGSNVGWYYSNKAGTGERLLAEGRITALVLEVGDSIPDGMRAYGELLTTRTRIQGDRLRDIFLRGRLDRFLSRVVILEAMETQPARDN